MCMSDSKAMMIAKYSSAIELMFLLMRQKKTLWCWIFLFQKSVRTQSFTSPANLSSLRWHDY